MWLYFLLLICSVIVPLALSFDKKLRFYRQLKYLIPSIIGIALCYIVFDIYFTHLGVWGFNPRYHSSLVLAGLPIEEWLFFLIIPYASIFLHDSIVLYFNKCNVSNTTGKYLTVTIVIFSLAVLVFNLEKAYTAYVLALVILVLIFSLFDNSKVVNRFYCTFLAILVPFILVNAILTGTFIEEPVVWYNQGEILGIRLLTIPLEDFAYAFSLVLFVLLLRNKLKNFSDGFNRD
jgi:lycopene cyclase domain-containing protein